MDNLHALFNQPLLELGLMAEAAKAIHIPADAPVTFVIDRTVNYTNICNVDCLFCAFYRHEGESDAYTLDYDIIASKAQGLLNAGGTQLLLQGGVNPGLPMGYYTDLVKRLRADFPALTLHCFSPAEIEGMAEISGQSLKAVIAQLIEAGIDSIPGGGAEILHDDVRRKISPKKTRTDGWLDVMRAAHELGLKTTATMMYGSVETPEHILAHLEKIRALQAQTGGFTAFIPWPLQKAHTKLQKLPRETTGQDFLRIIALSRIVLDNVPHIQSSWLTVGEKLCQTALWFGADDIGGLILEESVVTEAGVTYQPKSVEDALKLIHATGKDAAQRDTQYNLLKTHPHSARTPVFC
ncbi:MAG: cyclic dehypoxanthinyl futalosine synthase [Vampirovibrionales bacterium]|nr:cyclic dehypoxanthinyl futalosine synthase [Vampirovibrionales bacterium]